MLVIWTPEAEQDRIDIWNYIAVENPFAAVQMDKIFSDAVAHLMKHPYLGKAGTIVGTRQLTPHENYRLIYEISGETIWILALVHTARHWPALRGL